MRAFNRWGGTKWTSESASQMAPGKVNEEKHWPYFNTLNTQIWTSSLPIWAQLRCRPHSTLRSITRHIRSVQNAKARMEVHIGTQIIHETSYSDDPVTLSVPLHAMHVEIYQWNFERPNFLVLQPVGKVIDVEGRKVRKVGRTSFLVQANRKGLMESFEKADIFRLSHIKMKNEKRARILK